MSGIETRPATYEDIDTIMVLYREVQGWLRSKGLDQWSAPDGDEDALLRRVRSRIARSVKRDECYVAVDHGEPVGTITIDQYADPEFWRTEDNPTSALYLHRMMVASAARGQGIGTVLIDLAERLAVERGRPLLRLDAWRTNKALHAYYHRQGFTHVRTADVSHRGSGALFERVVAGTAADGVAT